MGSMTDISAMRHACCLLAEDQVLIGMEIETILDEVGLKVAGPFSSCADALAWAKNRTPDMALLDFILKDGPCTELVRTLLQRGVPVLVYSGIRQDDIPPDLRQVTWIEKPVEQAKLLDVLMSVTCTKWPAPQSGLPERAVNHPLPCSPRFVPVNRSGQV
jgi:DNA-binding NtrC family response regulator